jgi:HK97 family phage prohead protease
MPEIKRVSIDAVDIKMEGDDGAGEITGYASTFGNFDDVGERVVRGAFAPHLPSFLKDGFIAVGHNWSTLPIATPIEAQEDDHGLFVRAAFHSTPDAQHARTVIRERLERGKSVKLSIGYEVLDDEYTDAGRLLKNVRLFEWSYVTVPANQMAAVTGVKGRLLAGLPIDEQSDVLLAGTKDYVSREKAISELRAKEGKPISAARRARLEVWRTTLKDLDADIEALLIETAPPPNDEPKAAPVDYRDDRALYREWLRVRQQAAQLGVHTL